MSELICGKAAVGGNYNSTRDSKLTEYRKYVGRYELAKCSECIVKPGSGVEVYTNKRGNRYFDRGLWVNDDGYGNC